MIKCRILATTNPEATHDLRVSKTFISFRLAQGDSQRHVFLSIPFSNLFPVAVVTKLPLLWGSQHILFQVFGRASQGSGESLALWARWLNGHAISRPTLSLPQQALRDGPISQLTESLRVGTGCREAMFMSSLTFKRPSYCNYSFTFCHNTTKPQCYFGSINETWILKKLKLVTVHACVYQPTILGNIVSVGRWIEFNPGRKPVTSYSHQKHTAILL